MTIRDEKHVMEAESIEITKLFLLPWIVYDLRESDYAVDLYVRITEINQPVTAETIHIQLKSTKKIKVVKDNISLNNFPTKSLLTFENSYDPVYIVLCNLENKKLYWVDVLEEIVRLNTSNPKWKEQETNTIYFDLHYSEFTKEQLKQSILKARQKIMLKKVLKLKNNEEYEKMAHNVEIEQIIEDIFNDKIALKDENYKEIIITSLNYYRTLFLDYSDKVQAKKIIIQTLKLHQKNIKNDLFQKEIGIEYILFRISTLLFLLSHFKDKEKNLVMSINKAKKALKKFDRNEKPIEYYCLNYNISYSYELLYEDNPQEMYLSKQIQYLNKVLEVIDEKSERMVQTYSFINFRIARLYQKLLDHKIDYFKNQETIKGEIKNSILHYEKVKAFFTFERSVFEYELLNRVIGGLYIMLAELENPILNLKKGIEYNKKNLIIFEKISKEDLADTKFSLGVAYRGLYENEHKKEDLISSIEYLRHSLEILNLKEFPSEFGNINKNLGMDYSHLAELEDTENS